MSTRTTSWVSPNANEIRSPSLNLTVVFLPPEINVIIHQNFGAMIIYILIGCFGWLLEAVGGALMARRTPGICSGSGSSSQKTLLFLQLLF